MSSKPKDITPDNLLFLILSSLILSAPSVCYAAERFHSFIDLSVFLCRDSA